MKNVMIDHDDQWMDWLTSRAIISSTNLECQEVNDIPIKQLEGQLYMNKSYDVVRNQVEAHKYPTEFLNTIHSCFILKQDCCNGTKGEKY